MVHWVQLETAAGEAYCGEPIHERWQIGERIGEGSFAVVKRACSVKDSTKLAAIKMVKKRDDVKAKKMVLREVISYRMVASRKAKNVVDLYEISQDDDHVFLVMELVTGGDLAAEEKPVSENVAIRYSLAMVNALRLCHQMGVTHRDITPNNFMKTTEKKGATLKLMDFGVSSHQDETFEDGDAAMQTQCGTPKYMAPEVVRGQPYDSQCDLWSVGAVLYELLTGRPPFDDSDVRKMLRNIRFGVVTYASSEWEDFSPECRQFVEMLLTRDPGKRMTAAEAMKHEWLARHIKAKTPASKTTEASRGQEANENKSSTSAGTGAQKTLTKTNSQAVLRITNSMHSEGDPVVPNKLSVKDTMGRASSARPNCVKLSEDLDTVSIDYSKANRLDPGLSNEPRALVQKAASMGPSSATKELQATLKTSVYSRLAAADDLDSSQSLMLPETQPGFKNKDETNITVAENSCAGAPDGELLIHATESESAEDEPGQSSVRFFEPTPQSAEQAIPESDVVPIEAFGELEEKLGISPGQTSNMDSSHAAESDVAHLREGEPVYAESSENNDEHRIEIRVTSIQELESSVLSRGDEQSETQIAENVPKPYVPPTNIDDEESSAVFQAEECTSEHDTEIQMRETQNKKGMKKNTMSRSAPALPATQSGLSSEEKRTMKTTSSEKQLAEDGQLKFRSAWSLQRSRKKGNKFASSTFSRRSSQVTLSPGSRSVGRKTPSRLFSFPSGSAVTSEDREASTDNTVLSPGAEAAEPQPGTEADIPGKKKFTQKILKFGRRIGGTRLSKG